MSRLRDAGHAPLGPGPRHRGGRGPERAGQFDPALPGAAARHHVRWLSRGSRCHRSRPCGPLPAPTASPPAPGWSCGWPPRRTIASCATAGVWRGSRRRRGDARRADRSRRVHQLEVEPQAVGVAALRSDSHRALLPQPERAQVGSPPQFGCLPSRSGEIDPRAQGDVLKCSGRAHPSNERKSASTCFAGLYVPGQRRRLWECRA